MSNHQAETPDTGGSDLRETVRERYGEFARQGTSCCGGSSCCGDGMADALAEGVGYDAAQLAGLPAGANLGLSCGNPLAEEPPRPGEVILDLGSGAGFDAFLVARLLEGTGRVIGVDMTPAMLERARANLREFIAAGGPDNLEFRLGEIEALPVADASVDRVISNCVINLSPDKPRVWREIARVLKPGGRVSVSDLALLRPLPDSVRESVEALVGCIAGAVLIKDSEAMMAAAGLQEIKSVVKSGNLQAMLRSNDTLYRNVMAGLPEGAGLDDFVVSVTFSARKGRCCG